MRRIKYKNIRTKKKLRWKNKSIRKANKTFIRSEFDFCPRKQQSSNSIKRFSNINKYGQSKYEKIKKGRFQYTRSDVEQGGKCWIGSSKINEIYRTIKEFESRN